MRFFKYYEIKFEKVKVKKITNADLESIKDIKKHLNSYDYIKLETPPKNANELLSYYYIYTDPVYSSLKNLLDCFTFVVDNEIRAMLGHILDFDSKNRDDKNIDKAYGHFRRLNIDIFKILCDKLDLFYNNWLEQYYKYDFRGCNATFLQKLGDKYYKAKKQYTVAQTQERVGSDRLHHRILELYSTAALSYIEMLEYYAANYKTIKSIKIVSNMSMIISVILNLIMLIAAVLTFI